MSPFECCLCGFQTEISDQLEQHIDVVHWDIFKPKTIKAITSTALSTAASTAGRYKYIDEDGVLESRDRSLLHEGQTRNSDSANFQCNSTSIFKSESSSLDVPSSSQGLPREVQHLESTLEIVGPENPSDHKHAAKIKVSSKEVKQL